MSTYVLDFQEIDQSMIMSVGGKGANLGELSRITGIAVPVGFCVTTEAYKKITRDNQELNSLLDALTPIKATERSAINTLSTSIRKAIESSPFPKDMADAITGYLSRYDKQEAFAVRSSATAEDLPTASFAGQQDTYLNIVGKEAILQHISQCWASLFTERAITYRIQNGFDHRAVYLSVVVQKMVFPEVAGILFTADQSPAIEKLYQLMPASAWAKHWWPAW